MSKIELPRLALAVGDPAGIGPEICIKAAQSADMRAICRPLLVGDPVVLTEQARRCGLTPEFRFFEAAAGVTWDAASIPVLARSQFADAAYAIGEVNAANGHSALDSASAAIAAALAGEVEAVIAAPQTQKSIALAGIAFDGYPTFVARQTGLAPEDVFLMLCFDDRRIVHCTLHVSVRRALELITRQRVGRAIAATHEALERLGLRRPRILVAGLNPHAGEGGLFGTEDDEIVAPAIADARARGIRVDGPVGADLMLHDNGADAHVVMLHDQGHIPAKLLAKHRTAGLSIGSPILFSSVAHGSALDIAGRGKADPTAIKEAIRRLAAVRPAPPTA